jgi:hypothetical protein
MIDGRFYLLGLAKTDTSSTACLPLAKHGFMPSFDSIIYVFNHNVAFVSKQLNDTILKGNYIVNDNKMTIYYYDFENKINDTMHSSFHFFSDTLKIISPEDKLVFYLKRL